MIIEDYSTIGFDHLGKPSADGVSEGKFVHIIGPDDEFLILAPYEMFKWHAQIVSEFCRRHEGVSCIVLHRGEDARFDVPGWTVAGGGHYRLRRGARTLELGGSSKAYGPYNEVILPGKIRTVPGWTEYTISTR
ncbi:MAG: hypothetical protein Kow0074_25540 [Candidatus Zixiibacteriota bacterium]